MEKKTKKQSLKEDIKIEIDEINDEETKKKLINPIKKFRIHGDDVKVSIINSLRRSIKNLVPTYAFHRDLIDISKNTTTSITTNDYIINNIIQLPLLGLDPEIPYLEEEYYVNVNYKDPNRPKHPNEKNIELYIDVVNGNKEPLWVTTNDAKIYIDGEETKVYEKHFGILKLKKDEALKLHAKAVIGIGDIDQIWSPVCICTHFYGDDNNEIEKQDLNVITKDIVIVVQPMGQIDLYDIMTRACSAIQYRLKLLSETINNIEDEEYKNATNATIVLEEDCTICEIINEFLQDNTDKIEFCGGHLLTNLEKKYEIKIRTKDDSIKVFDELDNAINKLIKIYGHIEKKILKLK